LNLKAIDAGLENITEIGRPGFVEGRIRRKAPQDHQNGPQGRRKIRP
jgi:hypothetical protein